MHVLIVHPESRCFGGAEQMLVYFLEALCGTGIRVSLARASGSLFHERFPEGIDIFEVPSTDRLTPGGVWEQYRRIRTKHESARWDVLHGWSARSWEVVALAGWRLGCPVLGTLHDHPEAPYIGPWRRRLMRLNAQRGLRRVACVSHAVAEACRGAGYPASRLAVIHNGLPYHPASAERSPNRPMRFGFLGSLNANKGIDGLLQVFDAAAESLKPPWELLIGGASGTEADRSWLKTLQKQYHRRPWWPWVKWLDWVGDPNEFFSRIDLLLFTSRIFDCLPTVILEAGWAGVPVLAARVGGVEEIVEPSRTGWTFSPEDWPDAARQLIAIQADRVVLAAAGRAARARMERHFTMDNMVAKYVEMYSTLAGYVS